MRFAVGTAVLIAAANLAPAGAGTPVEQTLVCPVGGETFTSTGTTSCTVSGRTMSFRPITSCEFVTRLPVCPSNGLPLYTEFTADELTALTDLMSNDDYNAIRALPPWQRAYALNTRLRGDGAADGFRLLLNAMWYEDDTFFADPTRADVFLAEVEAEKARVDAPNHAFLDALAIYALAQDGRNRAAQARLTALRSSGSVPSGLLPYLFRLSNCIDDMAASDCKPDVPINN